MRRYAGCPTYLRVSFKLPDPISWYTALLNLPRLEPVSLVVLYAVLSLRMGTVGKENMYMIVIVPIVSNPLTVDSPITAGSETRIYHMPII